MKHHARIEPLSTSTWDWTMTFPLSTVDFLMHLERLKLITFRNESTTLICSRFQINNLILYSDHNDRIHFPSETNPLFSWSKFSHMFDLISNHSHYRLPYPFFYKQWLKIIDIWWSDPRTNLLWCFHTTYDHDYLNSIELICHSYNEVPFRRTTSSF